MSFKAIEKPADPQWSIMAGMFVIDQFCFNGQRFMLIILVKSFTL